MARLPIIDLNIEGERIQTFVQDNKPSGWTVHGGYKVWLEVLDTIRCTETQHTACWPRCCSNTGTHSGFKSGEACKLLVLDGVDPDRIKATYALLFM